MTQCRCLSIISFSRFSGGRRLLQISTSTVSDRPTPSQSTSLRSMWCPVSSTFTLTPTLTLSPWQPHYAFLLESRTAVSFTGWRPGEPGCRRWFTPRIVDAHSDSLCRRETRLRIVDAHPDSDISRTRYERCRRENPTPMGRRRTRHDPRTRRGTRHREVDAMCDPICRREPHSE